MPSAQRNIKITDFENNAFRLNSIVDSTRYVMLETTKDCLMGSIEKIKIVNDTIFIGDFNNTKSIYAYSITGNYLFKIATHGKGKGEFIYLNDFDIVDNKIVLYDEKLRKILLYNKSGEFITENHLKGFLGVSFASIGNNKLGFYKKTISSKLDNQHELLICDINGKILERNFKYENFINDLILKANPFSSNEDNTFFFPSFGYTIYYFNDIQPQPYLNVDFGKLNVTKQAITKGSKDKYGYFDDKEFATISQFISTKDFAILAFAHNHRKYYSLIEYPNIVHQTGAGFVHSIDTDFLPYAPCYSYKNNFVSVIESFHILQMLKNFSGVNELKKFKIFKQLGNKIWEIDNSSNPILVFYTLKKTIK